MSDWFTSGFRQDFEQLLKKFASSGGVLFRDFIKHWQDMKFALVFRGHPTFYEMTEFVEESFIVTKSYLSARNDLNTRIGALYTLYGLFYRQPTVSKGKGYVKIRMEYREWVSLKEFIQFLKQSGCYDACIIFYKMVVDRAFHFVCFTQTYGIVEKVKKRKTEEAQDLPRKKEKLELSSEILEKMLYDRNFTVSWRKKESEYNWLKKELKNKKLVDPEKIKETDLIDDILNELSDTHVSSSSSSTSLCDLGALRRALKNRSVADASLKNRIPNRPGTLASLKAKLIDDMKQKQQEEMVKNDDGDGAQGASGAEKSLQFGRRRDITFLDDLEDNVDVNEINKFNDSYNDGSNKSLPRIITTPSIGTSYLSDADYDDEEEIDSPSDSDSSYCSISSSDDSDSEVTHSKPDREEKKLKGVPADERDCYSLLFK